MPTVDQKENSFSYPAYIWKYSPLKRLIAIIARFDQGIVDAPGNVGIDKPAIREAKLILSSQDSKETKAVE